MVPADPRRSHTKRVAAACDRFKSEWLAGAQPRIDDYVAAAPEPDRETLRRKLLSLQHELQGMTQVETALRQASELKTRTATIATVERQPEEEDIPKTLKNGTSKGGRN